MVPSIIKNIMTASRIPRWYNTSSYFITTPIFYVNAAPHLGHLYTVVIADAAHRFHQLLHPNDNTLFTTGTDEHGQKVQLAAEYTNPEAVKLYCDNISSKYRTLFDSCGITYSKFIRTTEPDHKVSVQSFWNLLESKGHIYKSKHSGWYCVPDETFVTEKQLKIIEQSNGDILRVCEVSGHPVEWTEEVNFIFRLSSFRSDLHDWMKNETRIIPSKFHKALMNLLSDENSTNDISISRPISRIPWGIPVPSDTSQNVYVWLDALVNYLTVAGYPHLNTWPPTIHVVGKDILKFHGIYWPAFLISAGMEPPTKLFVHSHWTVNDEKMSKSKKNVVDPYEKINLYTASGFRYFLLKEGTPHSDANYTEDKVIKMLNADLANTFGNLLNRCISKTINSSQVFPKLDKTEYDLLYSTSETLKLLSEQLESFNEDVTKYYQEFNFYKGIRVVLKVLNESNKFFDENKPWDLRKSEANLSKLKCILHITMESLRICAIALQPIVPDISAKVFLKLNVSEDKRKWTTMKPSWILENNVSNIIGSNLSDEHVVLFNRLSK